VSTGQAIRIGVPQVQSIIRLDANPVSTGDAEFQVTFSEPVVGLDEADFSVVATGSVTGATLDHIHSTADPRIYEIHVKNFVCVGRLRVDFNDADAVASSLGAKVGGVGTGNGNFAVGETYTVVQAPPVVQAINIGDGTAQRSMVKQLVVVFSQPVT